MKGPKKETTKLSEQGIVTEEALIAYLNNKLSPEEKQELEKLLLNDPFAQDALEGLQSSANQAALATSISSLNKKVRERSGLKERKKLQIHWVNYAWAAALIGLLIGIGFIMINFLNRSSDHNLATNTKKEENVTPTYERKDTTAATEKAKETVLDSTTTGARATSSDSVARVPAAGASGGAMAQNKPAPVEVKSNANGAVSPANNGAYAFTTTATTDQEKKPVIANNNAKMADNVNARDETYKQKVAADTVVSYGYLAAKNNGVTSAQLLKKELKPETTDYAVLQDNAMKSFNAGDYNKAADDFDKILKHDPENIDALYFGGISDYINGKTAKSELNFDKLLKKGSAYADGSKWYKANILLKKGKSDAAKGLLQDLTNTNGSYKERAIKKLAELGF